MTHLRNPLRHYLLLAATCMALFGLAILLQIADSPRYAEMHTDSGLFAYTGSQILHGQVLYRDVWDEKPPGVYYLNAAAIALAGANAWTIWALSLVGMASAAIALFLILYRHTGWVIACLASLILLITGLYPEYYQGGNFTEVYALLPQVLTLGALAAYLASGKRGWLAIAGALTALAFLFKPTYIAIGAAVFIICIYLALRRQGFRSAAWNGLAFGTGAGVPLVMVGGYFARQGVLGEMLFAVFTYNTHYAREGFSLRSLYGTFANLAITPPLSAVFAVSLAAGAVWVWVHWAELWRPSLTPGKPGKPVTAWLFAAAILALPMEWVLVSISGKNFGHYFLTPLPAMASACAYLAVEVRRFLPRLSARVYTARDPYPILSLALVAVLGLVWFVRALPPQLPSRTQLIETLRSRPFAPVAPNQLQQYILDNSRPDQSVLVWGTHADLNFNTERRSPTRYPFTLPLLVDSPETPDRFSDYLVDLASDPPALIVAQPNASSGVPYFGVDRENLCPGCPASVRAGMLELKSYIESHYTLEKKIWDWVIYKIDQ